MKPQQKQILLLGSAAAALYFLSQAAKSNGGGYTVPYNPQAGQAAGSGGSVGKIVKEMPRGGTPCNDGRFSTFGPRHGGGVCSYHQGRALEYPTKSKESFKEFLKPYIERAEKLFVPRWRENLAYAHQVLSNTPKSHTKVIARQRERIKNLEAGLQYFQKVKRNPFLLDELVSKYGQMKLGDSNELDTYNGGVTVLQEARWTYNEKNGIGAIYVEIPPEFYECNDGTFTDRNGRRACTWHGGLKTGEPIPTGGGGSGFVQDVPLTQIQTNSEWFQNRADAYSTRSVEAIVAAVLSGRFVWTNFDPIQLWKAPGGGLYILSGHSRKEAFKRLAQMGVIYQGRSFDTIPAKIETGLSLDQAKQVARESNTLSTPETALERAAYYRNLRKTGEFTMRQLEDAAERTEGRNAKKVLAFSFLNTSGKTFAALEALQTADADSFANIEKVAQWIGNARKTLPMLTNAHENELYDWLVNGGGYGTRPGQINSEAAFKTELQKIVMKRTEFGVFNQNEPLNITSSRYASPVEAEYNAQMDRLRYEISELEKEKKEKLKRYAKDASPEQLRQILAPIEAGLRVKGQELQRLILKKNEILDAAKNQTSLFGLRRRA